MTLLRLAALPVIAIACLGTAPGETPAPETRCGILSNPTPANWWLDDRDGNWTIGVQGGYQAEGLETMPENLFEAGWVRTNGYYGYRCACLKVTTDRAAMRVIEVFSGKPRPMAACDGDKALQEALAKAIP
ncbi:MAG: DUF4087 domain-containing protein [Sphingomonadaceae bacterium]